MKTILTHRLQDAIEMAIRQHGKMLRKGDDKPYLIHPIAVLVLLVEWDANEDTCIAGLLHDVIEDADNDKERTKLRKEIHALFGQRVLGLVEDVTEQNKSLSWVIRKKRYMEHLVKAPKEAILVSCADQTHNISGLVAGYKMQGDAIWKRFNAPKEVKLLHIREKLKVYQKLLPKKYTHLMATYVSQLP